MRKSYKAILTLLFVVFASFGVSQSLSAESQIQVTNKDGNVFNIELVNPELNSNEEADRPADTFTLFTRDFVTESTKTNSWGVEVAVKDGEVTYVSESYSGNTDIPVNGYVISVIDSSGTELRDKLRNAFSVGDQVKLEGITLPQEEEQPNGATNQNGEFISIEGMDLNTVTDESIIYSTAYKYNSTKRSNATEFTVVDGTITNIITDGNSFIPLNGYVISVQDQTEAAKFEVGDTIELTGFSPHTNATMSATNQDGVRVIIDHKNNTRSGPMIVLYNSDYGSKTKTNPWGTEMVVNLNEEGALTVSDFRALGEGDDKGIDIPRWGFVLSAYGEPYRNYLKEGEFFSKGDTITLQGVSLIELDKQASFEYAAINPTKETNPDGIEDIESGKTYPGLRGPDQLIVYTTDWKNPTTGTNSYGFEVTVEGTLEDGTIVKRGGNDSTIPENGYVLSAHGEGASFLLSNAQVGANVQVNQEQGTVTISTTPESIITRAEEKVQVAKSQYRTAKEKLYDVDLEGAKTALTTAKDKLQAAKDMLPAVKEAAEQNDYLVLIDFLTLLQQSEKQTDLVYYRTLESKKVEGRAVWHRPTETSLEEIQQNLDEFEKNNFNLIFLESFYQGYSIFPSDTDLIKQKSKFKNADYGKYGNDLLKAYIQEAKKRGIEVHAWVEDFFVGVEWNEPQSPILEQKPEWALVHYDGGIITPNENHYLFMDPAIPGVRQLLIDLYSEMTRDYDITGLQLDYIRYPVGHYKSDSGYGEYSVNAFKEEYDIPEDANIREVIDREKNPEMWEQWNQWKQNNITTFVKLVRDELKDINPDLTLSTAIFANPQEAINKKMQNWPLWVENGWIDVTAPMAYFRDTQTVVGNVESMVEKVNGIALNYAGIAPSFMGLPTRTNAEQTRAAQLGQAQGSAIFASQFVLGLDDVQEVLQESTYRNEAILPHADFKEVIHVGFEDIVSKAERIYLPNNQMTKNQKKKLQNKLNSIQNMPTLNSKQMKVIAERVNKLSEETDKFASGPAANRLQENLAYLANIFKTQAKREEIKESEV